MSPNKAAEMATLVLLLSALLFAYSISSPGLDDVLAWPVIFLGSLAASLLYGLAWGWKGLAMCIVIAFTLTAPGFVVIIPTAPQFVSLLAEVGVVFAVGISLFLALIAGVVGAVLRGVVGAILHRRHKRPR
jgi:hypothetical protein